MSTHYSPKRLAQELLVRGICSTPQVAIETARRFEDAWERDDAPRAARATATQEAWSRRLDAAKPGEALAPSWQAETRRIVREAGDAAEDAVRREQDAAQRARAA